MLELVGAPNLGDNLKALATGGRIAVIGVRRGPEGRDQPARMLMDKRARIHGSTLRARPLEEKAARCGGSRRRCCRCSMTATLTVPVAETFQLDRAGDAYERFEAGGKLGKIVLLP